MLSGDFPFPGIDDDDETAILMAHLHEPPLLLAMIVPDLSPELETIVLRLLAKDPDERYQSADEAVNDLSAYVRGSIDPLHPLAKKMAADRRSIAHRAVFEHSRSMRPDAQKEKEPAAASPKRRDAATAKLPASTAAAATADEEAAAVVPSRVAVPPPEVVRAPFVPIKTEREATSPWARAARAARALGSKVGSSSGSRTAPLPVVSPAQAVPYVSSSASGHRWENWSSGGARRRVPWAVRQLVVTVSLGLTVGAVGGVVFLSLRATTQQPHPVASA